MTLSCKIVVDDGPQAGKIYELVEDETFVIGRGKDSHTQINDPQLSRVHCRIDWFNKEPWLVDAGSASGTLVNQMSIHRHSLKYRYIIQVGVSSLRFECEGVTSSLEKPAVGPLDSNPLFAAPEPKAKPFEELLKVAFAQFRLDAIIAIGSSGVVFKATDTEKNRPAAVKILTPDLEHQEEQKERFVRAMKTMMDIRHPHIVRIYGAGKKGPYCWTAMEYVQGDSLSKLIEWIGIGNSLPWKDVFSVAVQIGRALEEAEKRKIIHRNVTPNNILRRSKDCCHLLSDLMLAKALEGTQAKEITKPGQIVGELPYLPPERTMPGMAIDGRSDLYGLGAALYGLITGRPPCIGKTLVEVVQSIREKLPPKPSVFQRDIHPEFETIILTLLSKDPNDRFYSAKALMLKLRGIAESAKLETDWANWVG